MSNRVPEPSELIYLPAPSWSPVLIAIGAAFLLAGTFMGWYWAALGGAFVLGGVVSWWKLTDDEISRMRREQATETAVIPAEPIRRAE